MAAIEKHTLRTGWAVDGDLDHAQWALVGRRLGQIARCSQWWIGDWILYGARQYGEQYARAARLTGYDVQSLRNMAYVASRFPEVSRRRDSLSWSHHAELAALVPDEQDRWLARAERDRLSVTDLRTELRRLRDPVAPRADKPVRVCPECGHAWAASTATPRSQER